MLVKVKYSEKTSSLLISGSSSITLIEQSITIIKQSLTLTEFKIILYVYTELQVAAQFYL